MKAWRRRPAARRWREGGVRAVLLACALLSVATTAGIVVMAAAESAGFFARVSPVEFLTGTSWSPSLEPRSFGVLPLLCGTLLVVVGAALVALPGGLAAGLYLSEFAGRRTRRGVKPALELLAGVPTVVFGYFALTFVTPALRLVLPATEVFNALSASLVVGLMIAPMVASLCDDALRAVPGSMREAAYALGATPREVVLGIVVPAAWRGIGASFGLALSRAFGETIVVSLAAGSTPKMTLDPLQGVQTMTAYIVQASLGGDSSGTIEYRALFAVGGLLFAITLAMNYVAQRVMRRFREAYE